MEVAVVQSSGCCSDVLTQGNRLLQGGLAEPLPELTQEQLLEERARIKAALYAEYGTEIQRLLAEQAEHRIHHLAQETDADAGSHPLILHTEANKQLKVLQKESMDRLRQEIADSGKTFAEAEVCREGLGQSYKLFFSK